MSDIPLHRQIFNFARGLSKGSTLLSKQVFEGEKDGDYIAPRILCDTFCTELLLKCLQIIDFDDVFTKDDLVRKGVHINKHDYSDIFKNIDNATKAQIVETYKGLTNTAITSDDFESLLKRLGDRNFVDWRYIYESKTSKMIDYKLQAIILDTLGLTIGKKYRQKEK